MELYIFRNHNIGVIMFRIYIMTALLMVQSLSFSSQAAVAQDNYYQQKAERYQREVEYYTRKGDLDRAKTYFRYLSNAMDDNNTQLRYAAQADDKAAMYMKWAADALNHCAMNRLDRP